MKNSGSGQWAEGKSIFISGNISNIQAVCGVRSLSVLFCTILYLFALI